MRGRLHRRVGTSLVRQARQQCVQRQRLGRRHVQRFGKPIALDPSRSKRRSPVTAALPDLAQEVGDKDYAMVARGTDDQGNFIHVPEPTENFSPESLKLYEEIREAQAQVMMRGTANSGVSDIYGS